MQATIEIPPFRARRLIKADFRHEYKGVKLGNIEFLWRAPGKGIDGRLKFERYLLNTSEFIVEVTASELINWLNDVMGLDPHLYICYDDVDIMGLKEDLMMEVNL